MPQRAFTYLAIFTLLLTCAASAGATVNKSIHVDDGERIDRKLSSVNGSINVGARAELERAASTVNGSISVEDGSRTRDLSSVNGTVRVREGVTVDGDVTTVNGTARSGRDTVVTGSVETVNGSIELLGTTVHEDLRTINGRVLLEGGTRVQGDLIVEETRNNGWNSRRKPLEIELRDGSVIEGNVDVRDEDRKVIVRLSGGSAVNGQVLGAKVVEE